MAFFTCPKGHDSETNDFCSECGAKMGVASKSANFAAGTPATGACPDCGSARVADFGVFCEVCGYNFETGAHGQIPMPAISQEHVAAVSDTPATPHWTLVASTDISLKQEGSPDPPPDLEEQIFVLDREISLIGRRSDVRGVMPEIGLDFDAAVSHRHALLTRKSENELLLRDIGSSNGTRVNGTEIAPMTDVPLAEGDRVTLGYWTALRVEKR